MNRLAVGSVILLPMLLVVGCSELKDDLPPAGGTLALHGTGWTDSTSSNFHGKAIRAANWNMVQCRASHGPEYDGGTANVSCRTCHDQPGGPENCTTCHGSSSNPAPPRNLDGNSSRTARGVGAHQIHLNGGSISSGMPCSSCHNVPPTLYSAGHVDSPLPAEVPMGGFLPRVVTNESTNVAPAAWDPNQPVYRPLPSYSTTNVTCGNTYCHGYFKSGNDTLIVRWTDTSSSAAACGTCHGDVSKSTLAERALPGRGYHANLPSPITGAQCAFCHEDVVDANLIIVDKTKHVNGKLNVFGQERDF